MSMGDLAGRHLVAAALLAGAAAALGAVTTGIAGDTTATVDNTAPVIKSVSLPDTSLTPTAGGVTTKTATIDVEDLNGCDDLQRVDVWLNGTTGSSLVGPTNVTPYDTCSAGVATYTYDVNMQYYYEPGTSLTGDDYKLYIEAEDAQGATTNNKDDIGSLLDFTYAELAALSLNKSTLDFGTSIDPGATSSVLTLKVTNHGNVLIDTDVNGTNLSHATESATIGVGNIEYNLTNDRSTANSLTSTPATVTGFDLDHGSSASDAIYWWLTVPSGSNQWVPSGDYTGDVTVAAVKG